jgi:hypothetical protein
MFTKQVSSKEEIASQQFMSAHKCGAADSWPNVHMPAWKKPMNLHNCNIFYDKGPKSKVDEPRLAFTKFLFVAEKVGVHCC